MADLAAAPGPGAARFEHGVRQFVSILTGHCEANRALMLTVIDEGLHHGVDAPAVNRQHTVATQLMARAGRLLAIGIEAGVLRRADPSLYAAMLLGMVRSVTVTALVRGDAGLAERSAAIVEVFLGGAGRRSSPPARRGGARVMIRCVFVTPRAGLALAALAVATVAALPAAAQTPTAAQPAPLPLGPARERGASITPAFEGWYQNADGTYSLLVGYFNRNKGEALDIPVGPNNRIEPGPIDQGQPTHFQTGRQWGVFVIKVPKDFGTKAITWTITVERRDAVHSVHAATRTTRSSRSKRRAWATSRRSSPSRGATFTGPPTAVAATLTGTVNQPVAISVVVNDPKQTKKGSERTNRARRRRRRHRVVPQVPRARRREVRPGARRHQDPGRDGDDQRHLQPAGRVPAARAGQRRIGRRRCWLPVLLDEHLRQSHRQVDDRSAMMQ